MINDNGGTYVPPQVRYVHKIYIIYPAWLSILKYQGMCIMKELSNRKNIRLKGYDYSSAGYYFVTICVKDKHEMLGRIIVVGDAVHSVPLLTVRNHQNHVYMIRHDYAFV